MLCQFLLHSQTRQLYVCVCAVHSRSVLFNSATPWTVAHQAPLSMGFSRQEDWSGQPFPPPGDLPNPGFEPRSPTLRADSLCSQPPGKPMFISLPSFLDFLPFGSPQSRVPCAEQQVPISYLFYTQYPQSKRSLLFNPIYSSPFLHGTHYVLIYC